MRSLAQRSKSAARLRGASSKIKEHSTLSLAMVLIRHIELVIGLALALNHPPVSSQIVKNARVVWRTTV